MEREIKTKKKRVPIETYHLLPYAAGTWVKAKDEESEFVIIAAFRWEDDARAFKAMMVGVMTLTVVETAMIQNYCPLSSRRG